MSLKVKVFQTNPLNPSGRIDDELEKIINEWLTEHSKVRIVSVQTSSLTPLAHEGHSSGSVVCLVFYTEGTDGDRRAGFLRDTTETS